MESWTKSFSYSESLSYMAIPTKILLHPCSQIAERSLFLWKNSANKRNKSLFFNCRTQPVLYKKE